MGQWEGASITLVGRSIIPDMVNAMEEWLVDGIGNVIDSAVKHGVRRVICLSTDKAVYPINSMGMTKALMEKVAQAVAREVHVTLTGAERYVTPELKEHEARVLGADERRRRLEYELFDEVRRQVAAHGARIQATADALAILDILTGLADLAHDRNYCLPQMDDSTDLVIEEGRHPVIEAMALGERFVANDVIMEYSCEEGNEGLYDGTITRWKPPNIT